MSADQLRPGDLFLAKYEIVRKLGEGGMGDVYEAEHKQGQRRVAIKFLKPQLARRADVRARFETEARVSGQIESDNTVRLMDSGEVTEGKLAGAQFIILELLKGFDLNRFERRGITLPYGLAAELLAQACRGLHAAHQSAIVHRDIKPANLFVVRLSDGSVRLKVLDFGISKTLGQSGPTKTRQTLGTAFFMSPEQWVNTKDVDHRTDIWALGATLYVLVTGQHPFNGSSVGELCAQALNQPPTPPMALKPDLPPELNRIILRCLEKTREARFASALDLAEALRPFANSVRAAEQLGLQGPNNTAPGEPLTHVFERDADADEEDAGEPQPPIVVPKSAGQTTAVPMSVTTAPAASSSYAVAAIVSLAFAGLGVGAFYYFRDFKLGGPHTAAASARSEASSARAVEGTAQPVHSAQADPTPKPTAAPSPAPTEIGPTALVTAATSPLPQGAKGKPATTTPPPATPAAATTPTIQSNPTAPPPPTKVWCKSVDEKGNTIVKKCS